MAIGQGGHKKWSSAFTVARPLGCCFCCFSLPPLPKPSRVNVGASPRATAAAELSAVCQRIVRRVKTSDVRRERERRRGFALETFCSRRRLFLPRKFRASCAVVEQSRRGRTLSYSRSLASFSCDDYCADTLGAHPSSMRAVRRRRIRSQTNPYPQPSEDRGWSWE